MSTLPIGQAASPGRDKNSGGGAGIGASAAAPAHPGYTVGSVGFGPVWDDEEDTVQLTWHGWKRVSDSMAASIVRLEQENEELRAEVALLKQGMVMLAQERDEARFAARAGMTTEEMREDFLKEWRRDK
jgi:hypothetical protein